LRDVAEDKRSTKSVTMAQVTLSDGQTMRAVNDLFVGPRTFATQVRQIHADQQPTTWPPHRVQQWQQAWSSVRPFPRVSGQREAR